MAKLGYIQVTRQCNQECIICSNPPNEKLLLLKEAKKNVDQIISEGNDGLIITGGEPTLYKFLPELIKYSKEKGLSTRMITNGQKMSDINFVKKLSNAGLNHVHMSIYSSRDSIQSKISKNKDSLKNIIKALNNIESNGKINVDINIAISKINAEYLSTTVKWIVKKYPFIKHFVFNNLDPHMNRATENPEVVPMMKDFELELYRSLKHLDENNKTFRVERVPLCYMSEYEYASTETRKIVKGENRTVYFLDEKNKVTQNMWESEKAPWCKDCSLNEICAGIFGYGRFYSINELNPVFINKNDIIRKIKNAN